MPTSIPSKGPRTSIIDTQGITLLKYQRLAEALKRLDTIRTTLKEPDNIAILQKLHKDIFLVQELCFSVGWAFDMSSLPCLGEPLRKRAYSTDMTRFKNFQEVIILILYLLLQNLNDFKIYIGSTFDE